MGKGWAFWRGVCIGLGWVWGQIDLRCFAFDLRGALSLKHSMFKNELWTFESLLIVRMLVKLTYLSHCTACANAQLYLVICLALEFSPIL
jgi:hypothetical protein